MVSQRVVHEVGVTPEVKRGAARLVRVEAVGQRSGRDAGLRGEKDRVAIRRASEGRPRRGGQDGQSAAAGGWRQETLSIQAEIKTESEPVSESVEWESGARAARAGRSSQRGKEDICQSLEPRMCPTLNPRKPTFGPRLVRQQSAPTTTRRRTLLCPPSCYLLLLSRHWQWQ